MSTSERNDANSGLSTVGSSEQKDLTYQTKKSFESTKDEDVHPFGFKPEQTASEQETETDGAVSKKSTDVPSDTSVEMFMKKDSGERKESTSVPKTESDDLRVFQNMAGVDGNDGKEKPNKETEDELLGFGNKQIGGVNIEEIDEAVEKALLDEDSYTDKVSEKNETRPAEEDMEVSTVTSLLTSESDLSFQRPKNFNVDTTSKDSSVVNNMDMDVEAELRKEDTLPLHRPEQVYNIDEETRMSLDQTSNDNSMLASSFNYPLPPKRLFHLDDTKDSGASDNDTKLSTMTDTEDVRLSHTISIDPEATKDSVASDSNAADSSTPAKRARRDVIAEGFEDGEHIFLAENLFEYQWPLDGGEWHLLQEQISEFLKVKSFKRKYPDLYRRICDKEEKNFLREKGVVTETQSDLGLTALRSEEVYDLMMKDYNDKYREYISVLQEKQKRVIREKHKEYSDQAKLDKSKIESYSKKAARSAAEFNASLMRENREERRAYFDLQTYTIHHPKGCFKNLPPERTRVNAYPVSIISGQFQEYYCKYTPEELKYYPVKTSILDPPKPVPYQRPLPPGIRSPAVRNEKSQQRSDGEDASSSSEDDNAQDNMKEEADYAQKVSSQEDDDNREPFIKLDKKVKITQNKKLLKGKTHSSPDKIKPVKKTSNKDNDKETREDNAKNDNEDKQQSPDGKKIHGLEKCRICKQRSTKEERKRGGLVRCAQCQKIGHMNCLDLTAELVAVIKTYPWQCMECKTCVECHDPYDEDKMMFCDRCDRGYHTFCIGLNALPTGHWECKSCGGDTNVETRISSVSKEEAVGSETKTKLKEKVDGSENVKAKEIVPEETLENKVKEEKDDLPAETTESDHVFDASHPPVTTPGVKSETRGRKRKNPDTITKPVKIERIQGARQSRRLQLKEEEEEEKRKKEEKEKKMKKKKKKLLKAANALNANNAVEAEMSVTGEGQSEEKFDQALVQDVDLASNKDVGIPDDMKDIVCEGVDDSVSLFDKQDDEDNENEKPADVMEMGTTDQLGKMESNSTSCEHEKVLGLSEKESSSEPEQVGGSSEKGGTNEYEKKTGISEKDNTVEHENILEFSGVSVTNEDEKALGLSKKDVTSEQEKVSGFSEKESTSEHEEAFGISGGDNSREHEKVLEVARKETASDVDNSLILSEKGEVSEQEKVLEVMEMSSSDHAKALECSETNSAIGITKSESNYERENSDTKPSKTFTEKVAIPEEDIARDESVLGNSVTENKAVALSAPPPNDEQNYLASEQSAPSQEAQGEGQVPATTDVPALVDQPEPMQGEQEVTEPATACGEHASVSPGTPAAVFTSDPVQVEPKSEVVSENTLEGQANVHSSQAEVGEVTDRAVSGHEAYSEQMVQDAIINESQSKDTVSLSGGSGTENNKC